jgi:hypothetical protein
MTANLTQIANDFVYLVWKIEAYVDRLGIIDVTWATLAAWLWFFVSNNFTTLQLFYGPAHIYKQGITRKNISIKIQIWQNYSIILYPAESHSKRWVIWLDGKRFFLFSFVDARVYCSRYPLVKRIFFHLYFLTFLLTLKI